MGDYISIGSELVFLPVTINKSGSKISAFLGTKHEFEGSPVLSLPYFYFIFPACSIIREDQSSLRT